MGRGVVFFKNVNPGRLMALLQTASYPCIYVQNKLNSEINFKKGGGMKFRRDQGMKGESQKRRVSLKGETGNKYDQNTLHAYTRLSKD